MKLKRLNKKKKIYKTKKKEDFLSRENSERNKIKRNHFNTWLSFNKINFF